MPNPKEKIDEGVRLKEEGNKFVQAKEYRKACKCYRRVFAFANGLITQDNQEMAKFAPAEELLNSDDAKRILDLKLQTYTNLALCYLRLKEPEKALECANKALALDSNNIKALLRHGCASTELMFWESGKGSLLKALKLDPSNSSVKAELLTWKTSYERWLEQQKQKERDFFGGKLLL